eukprot:CAMPEP_0198147186 /NCGR_PEP_ID=MMETSP1443-20131203/33673_1 /TAXON_ID=186043 /ORGANISM="Entomoneis sp., Strain CCMP2396" /LENGTH=336 /DNA_ID=CAMNT_0043811381 /DNA_START=14 /DNA_END=1027 /DNA_ORIENTATION=-
MKVERSSMNFFNGDNPSSVDCNFALPSKQSLDAEYRRLRALQSYDMLDRAADDPYERLASMAARFLKAPVARIVFVDLDRCWTAASSVRDDKASKEVPRKNSVYERVVFEQELVTVIPDVQAFYNDAEQEQQQVVDGTIIRNGGGVGGGGAFYQMFMKQYLSYDRNSEMRFYAGAALVNGEGHILGTLAVLDTEPRANGITAAQLEVLVNMASSIVDLMEEKRKQLLNGVNMQSFQPNLLRSARFVVDQLEHVHSDADLRSMMRHHQTSALNGALMSAQFLEETLKPKDEKESMATSSLQKTGVVTSSAAVKTNLSKPSNLKQDFFLSELNRKLAC